jgi:hypothetical protein
VGFDEQMVRPITLAALEQERLRTAAGRAQ